MKIFKFLQGLVGFGNLRFAEIKSCPSASPTYGDFMPKMTVEKANQRWKRETNRRIHKRIWLGKCVHAFMEKHFMSFVLRLDHLPSRC